MVFIDFRKAFDSVNRELLWQVLGKFGIPDVFLQLVKQFYVGTTATVSEGGGETEPFPINCGVKQGCVLAPSLFNLFLAAVFVVADMSTVQGVHLTSRTDGKLFNLARLKAKTKVQLNKVIELLYADDTAFVSSSLADLELAMRVFSDTAAKFGLAINTAKTKVMYQPPPGEQHYNPEISINGETLESVQEFVYLGTNINVKNSMNRELQRRLQAGAGAFGKLRARVWSSHNLRLQTKCQVYRAVVMTSMLYGLEASTLYKKQIRMLTSLQVRHLRTVMGISWQDFVPSTEILRRANLPSMETIIAANCIRWAGHVTRMDNSRIPKIVMYSELRVGSRSVGGQKLRFKDVLKRNLKATGICVDTWEDLATERSSYRKKDSQWH